MTSKMPTDVRHWEITREKGRWKFILQNGLLWGAFMFGLNQLTDTPKRYSILVNFGIALLVGVIFTIFVWITSERRYRRYTGHEVKPHEPQL